MEKEDTPAPSGQDPDETQEGSPVPDPEQDNGGDAQDVPEADQGIRLNVLLRRADTRSVPRRLLILPLLASLLFLPGCFWLAPLGAIGSEESESGSSTIYGPEAADEGMTDVRAAIPAIEAYYADNGTYKGATLQVLQQRYDAGIRGIEIVKANDQTYCVESTNDGFPWYKAGPTADILPGDCSMPALEKLAPPPQTDADMCIQLEMNGELYYQVGPNGQPTPGRCPS